MSNPKEQNTINLATTFVMRRESAHINSLTRRVSNGEENMVEELVKEKQRLSPKGKFDHEEVFIGMGVYLTGTKLIKGR